MKTPLFLKCILSLILMFLFSSAIVAQLNTSSLKRTIRSLGFTVNVPLGGNIQTAVNTVTAKGGGTVNLAAGTYILSSTLYIKNNVTLNGSGMATTIIKAASAFNVIENANEGLVNVTIQNLKVVGKHSVNCYGILIQAGSTYHNSIKVLNVEVFEAGMGVHFKRVNNLIIAKCNFHHNGSLDQMGFYHNLYIRSCNIVNVSDTYLNDCISANGLNVSYCKNVTISNCVANNNSFRGMRAADTDGFAVLNCTMNSNGDVGLLANTEVTPTTNINWYKCTVTGNKNGGFKVVSGVTGSITYCKAIANGVSNYNLKGSIIQLNNN